MAPWGPLSSPLPLQKQENFPQVHYIELRHPGYDDIENSLFYLPAFDYEGGGISKVFAVTACAVVAGNKWQGYFSATKDGEPLEDDILVGSDFYFHNHQPLSDSPCPCHVQPYPVYPTWQSWPFPHGNLPPWWPEIPRPMMTLIAKSTDTSTMITARDQACRFTGVSEACEAAHLIPVKEEQWFMDRRMEKYSSDIRTVDSYGNQLLLRKDIHFTMERLKWTIFPLRSQWVYYALDASEELASQFHRRPLPPINGVQPAYLLAAFARAIFPLLNNFLRRSSDKYLIGPEVGTSDPAGEKVSGQWCFTTFLPPGHRSRSNSPTKNASGSPSKRKRGQMTPEQGCRDQSSTSPVTAKIKRSRSPSVLSLHSDISRHTAYNIIRDPLYDGPCVCPILPPSPSATLSSHSQQLPVQEPSQICFSDHCTNRKEQKRFNNIRQEQLKTERARSDPNGSWESHLRQLKEPHAVAERGVNWWFWTQGQEILDKSGEHVDTTEKFIANIQQFA